MGFFCFNKSLTLDYFVGWMGLFKNAKTKSASYANVRFRYHASLDNFIQPTYIKL